MTFVCWETLIRINEDSEMWLRENLDQSQLGCRERHTQAQSWPHGLMEARAAFQLWELLGM
jgi:hypothetical protein